MPPPTPPSSAAALRPALLIPPEAAARRIRIVFQASHRATAPTAGPPAGATPLPRMGGGAKDRPVKGAGPAGNGGGGVVVSAALDRTKIPPAPALAASTAADAMDGRNGGKIGFCALAAASHAVIHDLPQVRGRARTRAVPAVAIGHDRGAADAEEVGMLIKNKKRGQAIAPVDYPLFHMISKKSRSPRIQEQGGSGSGTTQSDSEAMKKPPKIRTKSMMSISTPAITPVGSNDSYISGLSSRLSAMGVSVSDVRVILEKKLSMSDCSTQQSRLLLSKSVIDATLKRMLTPDEYILAFAPTTDGRNENEGLPVLTLDRHGRSYQMRFRYVGSCNCYRLIGQWRLLKIQNDLQEGDSVRLGAIRRSDGQLVLTLLHLRKPCEEAEASKTSVVTEVGKEEECTPMETDEQHEECKTVASKEEGSFREEEASGKEGWSSGELDAAEALVILSL